MSDRLVPAPDELPLESLLRLARREIDDPYGEAAQPALVALHGRPTREVFDRAVALMGEANARQHA